MARVRPFFGKFHESGQPSGPGTSALPVVTSPARLARAIAEASASLLENVAGLLDLVAEPVTFSSGEAAIAMGWSHIDDLEACVSSFNAALRMHNSKSVEIARVHFGNDVANRVRLLNETALDTARFMLEHRIFSIDRAFSISGKLIETDADGNLRLGRFVLTYDDGDIRAMVGSDQQIRIVERKAAGRVSPGGVAAAPAWGKSPP